MSVKLPNGTTFAIATAYGASKNMTAVTNADPGVATLEASHGITTGDFFEVTSGWSRLTNKIVKAGTVATNDVPLLGIDTSLTSGSFRHRHHPRDHHLDASRSSAVLAD